MDGRRGFFAVVGGAACATVAAAPAMTEGDVRHPHVRRLRQLLAAVDASTDFARLKAEIDHLIDPSIDVADTVAQVDGLAVAARRWQPARGSVDERAEALRVFLYEPGPWNAGRAFAYDFDDPLGTYIPNKLLGNYLRRRKGNCVSMPCLHVALARRLGLEATLASAPQHMLVKLRDRAGAWHNVEPTSGGHRRADASYRADAPMTDQALANGLYLRALPPREAAVLVADVLMEHFGSATHRQPALLLAITGVLLEAAPRHVTGMLHRGRAYLLLSRERFGARHHTPGQLAPAEREVWLRWARGNHEWFERAEALGWREPPKDQDEKDRARVRQAPGVRR